MDLKALSPIPIGVINRRNGCGSTFGFESLIPNPYRRDQPAQRLRFNGCGSTVAASALKPGVCQKKYSGCNRHVWNMSGNDFKFYRWLF
ncbi:MAG: hypothetical protein PHE01_10825 [Methanosarcina sp.]|nr:hypothetical protein [Methanosarcina sp.]